MCWTGRVPCRRTSERRRASPPRPCRHRPTWARSPPARRGEKGWGARGARISVRVGCVSEQGRCDSVPFRNRSSRCQGSRYRWSRANRRPPVFGFREIAKTGWFIDQNSKTNSNKFRRNQNDKPVDFLGLPVGFTEKPMMVDKKSTVH